MVIRWAPTAVDDLERIHRYLAQSNPAGALRMVQTIYEAASSLETLPTRGRMRRHPGARELVFPPWPYILVYRIAGDAVEISPVWHRSPELDLRPEASAQRSGQRAFRAIESQE